MGKLKDALSGLRFLCSLPNMETHADLIAGLPLYRLEEIFEDVRTLAGYPAGEIQLESLKLLPGTEMRRRAEELGIRYSPMPPYEVLETREITADELQTARQLSRLLDGFYNTPAWQGITRQLIVDHEDFLHKMLDYLIELRVIDQPLGLPETISCRYNPGGVFKMSNGIMDNPGDAKYGFTHEQIIEGFKILKEKGAKYFGIHAFLASNTVTNEYYPKLARQLFELVVELRDKTGCDIKFINLSGGVGIPYRPDQIPNDIRVIGEGVREAFEEILVPAGLGDISIYSEMGRFMLGPYGCLVTKAIHEKHTYKEYIGVDACAANLMRPAIYGAYHHITVMGKENEPCDHKYDVTGSLCENCDKFAIDRMLPKIDMGDLLVIHDTGAHGFSMGYNYNGRLRSAEILLKEDGSTQLIRRAETPDDYFATFDCFDILKNMKHPEK